MEIDDYIVANDQQLVVMVLEGDDTAFEYLFERYNVIIRRLFVQRLGSDIDADDLVQETFERVYFNLSKYNPEYTFGQWIYAIARNRFIDYARKKQDDLPLNDQSLATASSAPTPEESVINLQRRAQIERYLDMLTPQYRKIIVMRFFEELSYEEIAVKLRLPLSTVRTQIRRSREQMRHLITEGDKH